MATTRYYGTGRRKSSVARVYLVPGTGKVTINKKDMDEYFGYDTLKVIARQPLELTSTADKFDVLVNVHGGGYTGQAGAIRHGIARALLEADPEFRPALKKERNTVSRKLVEHLSSANVNFVYSNYKFQTAATTSQGSNPLGGFFVECALVISCTCRCG